jgi:aryl-alcohol dehydrogenase-like predicted oxidoreductase
MLATPSKSEAKVRYVEAAGVRLSSVGLGAWQFGSGEWAYGQTYVSEVAPAIVHRSLDLGINLVDTAEIYGRGRSERIVGEAIADRRDEVFLASKILPVLAVGGVVAQRARGSLRRLDVETLDLYQLHFPNPLVPIRHTTAALARLQRDGLIRHVGVSNFSLAQWREAERTLLGPVISNQVSYSLINRRPERELIPWAQANDRIIIAYSPLGQGLLSGRYDEAHPPRGARASTSPFLAENLVQVMPLLAVLREVAEAHGATSAQVALAWLLRHPNVVVIPGASSVAQAESNAAAADLVLTDAEYDALTAASDAYEPRRGAAAAPAVLAARARAVAERARQALHGLRA